MKNLAGILPAIALAACLDQSPESGLTGPVEEVSIAAARGAAIAQSMCAPCHGDTYSGGRMVHVEVPSLVAVRDYSLADFDGLLASGVKRNGSPNGFMTATKALSTADRAEVFRYLRDYFSEPW